MKLKFNTLKGKLLAGAMAVGLVAGAGLAFANTDAGAALKQWYDRVFNQAIEAAEAEATDYFEGELAGLASEVDGLKDDATNEINTTRDSETNSGQDEITAAKDSHLASLEDAKREIEEHMGFQFYDAYMQGWLEIQRIGAESITNATNDLVGHTGEIGTEALTQVTDDLTTATNEAVTELEDAIEAAKGELMVLIDSSSENLIYNLTKEVDFEVERIRETVTTIKENLVSTQQALIAAKAEELVNAAKSSLDDLVSGINN